MDFDVLSLVKTKSEAEALIRDIDILIDSLYRTDSVQIRSRIQSWVNGLAIDRAARQQQLQAAKDQLLSLEYFQLTLAFEPTEKVIIRLANWCREQIDPQLVLDIRYEPGLIGGAVIEYQGKFVDLSLRKKFESL